ncbi:hypothetical protein [Mycetohabitans rhizoxinica]|uniref:Uncharacterized protein n=1 Tax=Mycetohabitans rhizoxinica TaxID=412963 RepID=A0ABZ2Q247_9BURK
MKSIFLALTVTVFCGQVQSYTASPVHEANTDRISPVQPASKAANGVSNTLHQSEKVVSDMWDEVENASAALTISKDPTPEVRAMLYQNVLEKNDQFRTNLSPPERLGLVREAYALLHQKLNIRSAGSQGLAAIIQRTDNLRTVGMELLGQLPDGGRRGSIVFKMKNGKLGMLSVWDYAADGGKIILYADFARQRVGQAPAILALGKAPNDDRRLWSLGWTTDTEDYELYLEDAKTTERDTEWQPEEIIQFAEQLMN